MQGDWEEMKDRKHLYWIVGLVLVTIILCGTLIWINLHSWTVRFEMDDNTRDAIESIEWDKLKNKPESLSDKQVRCGLPLQVYPDPERYYADNNTEFWDAYYECMESAETTGRKKK